MADEAKLCSSIHSTFEVLVVCPMVGCCHGGESGPFCWPMPAAGIAVFGASHQFAETLRCNGFAGIQKAVVDETDSRSPKTMTFIWLKFGFENCFVYSSQSSHWLGHCQLSYKIHFSSHIIIPSRSGLLLLHRIRKDDTSKLCICICICVYIYIYICIFGQLMRYSVIKLFHLSNLFQVTNDHRMVDTEFFSYSSYSFKRISFSDCSQWVIVNLRWLTTMFPIFKSLVSFAKLLELPLYCTFISSSWAKCLLDVASCLHCFTTHFELK